MSATKVIVRGRCNDCGEPHGRSAPQVAFCRSCLTKRLARRKKTAKYRAYNLNYEHSAKGKIRKAVWHEKNLERRRAQNLASYYRRRPPQIRHCQVFGCTNTFPQIPGSHAILCRLCARVMHGRKYARRRKAA